MPPRIKIKYRTRTVTQTRYRNRLSDKTIGGRVGNATAKGIDKTIKGVKSAAKSVGETYSQTGSDIANAGRATGRAIASGATRAKNAVKDAGMAVHKDMSKNRNSGYKQLGAAGIGGAAAIGTMYASSKWSEHKRKQRGY